MFEDETRENEIELSGRQNFKVNVFYVICDGLARELKRRLESYSKVESTFKCFFTNDDNIIDESLTNLSAKYQGDIEIANLKEEFPHFQILCNNTNSETVYQKLEQAQSVRSTFPNIITLLEIYLTISLSNASAERSFSTLKRIKNYLRSTMGQTRLDALSLLYIENKNMDNIDSDAIIKDFALKKARKKYIY